MNDLSEFLLARIAEDEDAARRAAFGYGAGWASERDDVEDWSVVHADGQRDMVGCEDRDVTRHIARHDPARILAECDAKRRIITLMRDGYTDRDVEYWSLYKALQCLALPFAGHESYREEWRP